MYYKPKLQKKFSPLTLARRSTFEASVSVNEEAGVDRDNTPFHIENLMAPLTVTCEMNMDKMLRKESQVKKEKYFFMQNDHLLSLSI